MPVKLFNADLIKQIVIKFYELAMRYNDSSVP
jgi:hypothetical protein